MGQPAALKANSEVHFTFSSMRDFRKNLVPQAHVRANRRPTSQKTESELVYKRTILVCKRVHIDAGHHACI